ncbi:unnamed protein product [Sphagnum jensenii]|uniref:Uncharacterized protein n=2 Tax=Sphagnum jensenii TaxID=128206 RepID=A0ABP0VNZ1_9BRYO
MINLAMSIVLVYRSSACDAKQQQQQPRAANAKDFRWPIAAQVQRPLLVIGQGPVATRPMTDAVGNRAAEGDSSGRSPRKVQWPVHVGKGTANISEAGRGAAKSSTVWSSSLARDKRPP